MASFLRTLQNTAHRFHLWEGGDKILIAVSGGPDSLCLLDVLATLAKKEDWTLAVLHVNYRLRGADSDADEALVRRESDARHLPVSVLHPSLPSAIPNLEASLRDIRSHWFEKTRHERGFDRIALGHTEDDQAETLLLRLLRGSGLRGLGAMRPREGRVIRPLLRTSKASVLRYLREKNLPFRIDGSNTDLRFVRNRIRHELLPLLETWNPRIRETIARTAITLADDEEALSSLLEKALPQLHEDAGGTLSFPATDMTRLHPAIQRTFFRRLVTQREGRPYPPPFEEVEEMIAFVASKKNKSAEKRFRGLKLTRRGDRVSVLIEHIREH